MTQQKKPQAVVELPLPEREPSCNTPEGQRKLAEREARYKAAYEKRKAEEQEAREQATVRKGQLIAISDGEYSDYQVWAMCRATCDFKPWDEWTSFMRDAGYGEVRNSKFLAWLITERELLQDVEWRELHLGSMDLTDRELDE